MPRICDRSPCDPLLSALGHFIFGSSEPGGGFVVTVQKSEGGSDDVEVPIDYCPFCGTRLEEVPIAVVEKFMRSRRRRRAVQVPVAS